mgnify:CR=1 FL=1
MLAQQSVSRTFVPFVAFVVKRGCQVGQRYQKGRKMTESDQEFLETGYEPSTPESDNLLRSFLGNWTATIETLAGAMSGETHRTDRFSISDTGKPGGYVNTATLLKPLPAEPGQVISEIDRIFSRRARPGIGESLTIRPSPAPELPTID